MGPGRPTGFPRQWNASSVEGRRDSKDNGSVGLGPQSPISKNVLVIFLCLWTAVYGGLIGASFPIIAPELYSMRLRTYGMASSAAVYELFAFAAAFYTPYMLSKDYGNMGNNVAYFYFGTLIRFDTDVTFDSDPRFIGINAALLILVFLFVPETARLTLEQIDDYFLSGPKAWKTSTSRNKRLQREHEPTATSVREKISEVAKAEHLEFRSAH